MKKELYDDETLMRYQIILKAFAARESEREREFKVISLRNGGWRNPRDKYILYFFHDKYANARQCSYNPFNSRLFFSPRK